METIKNRDSIVINLLKEIKNNINIRCNVCESNLKIMIDAEIKFTNLLISKFNKLSLEIITLIINRNCFTLQLLSKETNNRLKPAQLTCINCCFWQRRIDILKQSFINDVIVLSLQKYNWKQIMFSINTKSFTYYLISFLIVSTRCHTLRLATMVFEFLQIISKIACA